MAPAAVIVGGIMLRRFFNDTLELLLEIFSRLGLLRGGAQWWRMRLSRRLSQISSDAENTRRAVRSEHRMCRECRALVAARERFCTQCGAPMSGIPRGGLGRIAAIVLPSFGSASLTLVGLLVTMHLALTVASSQSGIGFSVPGELLWKLGAKWTPGIMQAGQWWRLVNPIFLHGSLMHIGFNAYALANLGPVIEEMVGARRFIVLFVITGICSFIASAWFSPMALSVGASGALFGLIGFGIVFGYLRGGSSGRFLADQLTRWALFGVVMIFLPMGIDHAAHAGGFIAGAVFGALMPNRRIASPFAERLWTAAAVVSVALPATGLSVAIVEALRAA